MKLKTVVGSLALLGLATHALAQTPAPSQRITVTGSSIKRIAAEGALPVQTISAAELTRQGIVNAEQLIVTLTSNGNGLDNMASNADVVSGQSRGNNGATSANLRGQGSNATLILLNGRRIAAHGLNGGTVDLNQIPMAAVERVEVLKDGASSIYGTDAIGGVINFILRNNFQGLRAAASVDVTEAGGGNIHRASLAGGFGDIDTDGFNLLATLSVTESKRLNGSDRSFVNSFQPERGLSPDTRGTPFATVFTVNTTLPNALTRPGGNGTPANNGLAPLIGGVATNGINVLDLPGGAGCASQPDMGPYQEVLWAAGAGARYGCAWDSGKSAVIQQPVKNTNLVTRGTLKLGSNHMLIGEMLLGKSESAKSFSENQISGSSNTANITLGNGTVVPSPFRDLVYPSTGAGYDRVFNQLVAAFPELAVNRGNGMAFRWRCMDCGQRQIATETDTSRFLVGLEGVLPIFGGWDYRAAVSQAKSKSKSVLGSGYHYMEGFANLLKNGTLNPFLLAGEQQTPAAMAALEGVSARGVELYGGEFTMTQVDAVMSGPVFKLPAGDVLMAVGVDSRSEKYKFNGNNNAGFSSISSWVFNAPFDNVNALAGVKRDVNAVYTEVIIPVHKTTEINLSVRHDRYTGFGGTTNPKASLRFQPIDSLLFRASYSTGFRVPTFNQLYNGITESPNTGAGVPDPATCPANVVSATPGCEAITFTTLFGGRPELGPEESKMANVGVVWQPTPGFSASLDWWDIQREGAITSFTLATLRNNYKLFPEAFIRETGTNRLLTIDTRWLNAGDTVTKGLELSLRGNTAIAGARVSAGLDGSYLLEKKSRIATSPDFGPSEVGVFTRSSDLGIRWKHTAFVTYGRGDWNATLRQQYSGKYAGYVPPGMANGNFVASATQWDPIVKAYTLYHANVSYTGIKNLTLTAGIKNLFDKAPPYANSYDTNTGSGSSWEPRVADPRGRSFQLGLDYTFF
ncbi:MAG: TonB-dependent receptor [Rubrivivax sp.]|nr:TonB-dependent receptor [Rubrivivax sp.]